MAESVNPNNPSPRAPQITALSTAFPMHFETNTVRTDEDPRRAQAQTTRTPHRHDAGE
ncbi:MAG: hypothetical protein NXI07_12170 [bacterium]|nr:hypothetical protein [bacterium]